MKHKFWISSSIALLILGGVTTPIVYAETNLEPPSELTQPEGGASEGNDVAQNEDPTVMSLDVEAAANSIVSGTWGTASYEFDEEDGTLLLYDGELSVGTISQTLSSSIKHIIFGNNVKFPSNSYRLFRDFKSLETVVGIPDTSNVTTMSEMFAYNSSLDNIDVSQWDTSNVTSMSSMFAYNSSLDNIDVSQWNTSNVTNMAGLFCGVKRIFSIDVSQWNTSNVTNMSEMFSGASILSSIDVSQWDTSNVTNMYRMFSSTSKLSSIDVSQWNTSNVTNMSEMFSGASILSSIDVSQWNTSNVTNMSEMFSGASILSSIDVSQWNTSNVTNMSAMFSGASILSSIDVSQWDTSNVTNMYRMFSNAYGLINVDLSNWDVSMVTTIENMFFNEYSANPKLTSLNVKGWNVSSLENAKNAFSGLTNVTSFNAEYWNAPKLKIMTGMFSGLGVSELSLKGWNTPSLEKLDQTFSSMKKLTKLNVSDLNTSNVNDMYATFSGASSLKVLDVSNWDVSKVTSMYAMFSSVGLEELDLTNWNISKLGSTGNMFASAKQIKKIDLGTWDTKKLTYAWGMFDGASNLSELVLTNWDFSSITEASYMFRGTNSLSKITLGEKIRFSSSVIAPDLGGTVNLPSINTSQYQYSGRWINKEASKIYNSSSLFMEEYDGTSPGTYVWEKNIFDFEVKDISLYAGDLWNPSSGFLSGNYYREGDPGNLNLISFNMLNISQIDTVNTNRVGRYKVSYSLGGVVKNAFVNVLENQESIEAKDSNIYVNDTWNPTDNFISAKSKDGNTVDFNDIIVDGNVDTNKAGNYEVIYINNGASKQITVTVLENSESLSTKDLTIFEGDDWTGADHFIDAKAKDGSSLSFDQLSVEGQEQVNPSKAGIYSFKVINGKTSNTVNLTVLKDQASITVKDSSIMTGASWTSHDNFVSATDRYGNPVTLGDLTVTGNVDTSKAGKYKVTYSWAVKNEDGSLTGDILSVDAYITVTDKTTSEPTTDTPSQPQVGKTTYQTKIVNNISTRTIKNTPSTRNLPRNSKILPQTGDESSVPVLAIGAVLLALAGVLGFFGFKKRKQNK
ncbi:BspA family leucine-rich repeat surface protein [Lactococcus sp. dk322]|uniref:BspA family leucine-rich repeat surface protein n=1 Tax=Lactococcus sp. dk322 TaxID=2603290 RepID=UPI0011CC5306|nr:BspA family leucine-rich repeat surface protein [Lactococcus sp. dk322]TXK47387.1 BspA family leucine-rich repeat surface protein [Lactococcus sp. dk322]